MKNEIKNVSISYIYSDIKKESNMVQKKEKSLQNHHLSFKREKSSLPNKINEVSRQSKAHRLLLDLLHQAIAEKQSYPESAIALNQSGTVSIQFVLYPNGEIKNIMIVKSSGIESLDEAAVSAIEKLSSFQQAALYLKSKETFLVDIVF